MLPYAKNSPKLYALILVVAVMPQVGISQEVTPESNEAPGESLTIQYREIVDDTVYGHSGLPAGLVLEELAESDERRLEDAQRGLKQEIDSLEERLRSAPDEESGVAKRLDEMRALHADENALKTRLKQQVDEWIADVEPVCESAAVVLNDALAQKDKSTLNPKLIELAPFYPGGVPEPAWAVLVRSRRLVVYVDGDGYCRLFLPGRSAAAAWEESYGVVRHILRSLLKGSPDDAALNVDVYAYEHNVRSTTFTLHLGKISRHVTAKDLDVAPGLRSVNLAGIENFFAEGLILEGCGVNPAGELVLIGLKGDEVPTLEGDPIEVSDLAVAYRAAAYAGHGESYMSLDKSPDSQRVNVNFGGRLHDTRLGWVAYRCDLRFKTLGDDLDAVTFDNVRQRICDAIPDFSSQQQRRFMDPRSKRISSESTRFWFYADDFGAFTSAKNNSFLVTCPRFTAAAERQGGSDQTGGNLGTETPPWTAKTLEHFNLHYEKFGKLFPEVRELDHSARLLAVGEWLHRARKERRVSLDLDELLTVQLPAAPTPRSREQLQVAYAIKADDKLGEYKAYCLSTPSGRTRLHNDRTTIYDKNPTAWKLLRVIGGGLDFSARKALENAKPAEGKNEKVLEKALTSDGKEIFDVGDGRMFKVSAGAGAGGGKPPEPPGNSVKLAANGEGPRGPFEFSRREYSMLGRSRMVAVSASDGNGVRHQMSDANSYEKDGVHHSIWVNENGIPERFATRTSDSHLVAYRIFEEGNSRKVVKESIARAPSSQELKFLCDALQRKGAASAEVWNAVSIDTDIRAMDVRPNGEAVVQYSKSRRPFLYVAQPGGIHEQLEGDAVSQRMHEISVDKVREYSVPGQVELLHARSEGKQIILTVGKRDPVVVDAVEWGKWLITEGIAPGAAAGLFQSLAAENGGKGLELVIMRDALQSRPERLNRPTSSTIPSVREFQAVLNLWKSSDAELESRLIQLKELKSKSIFKQSNVDDEMEALIEIRKHSPEERSEMIASLEAVLYLPIAHRSADNAVELTAALKSKLGSRLRISLDDPSPEVHKRVLNEGQVALASDVGLAVPPHRAHVDDREMLPAIIRAFTDANLRVIKKPADLANVGSVLVIAAHNDRALFDYIQTLGEHKINGKSVLDGKFVLLETCFEPGNPNLVSEMLRRYNCSGVHLQTDLVHKDAVKRVLIELAAELKKLDGSQSHRLRDIYDETVRKLLAGEDPEVKGLREEFQKLLKATVQWCMILRPQDTAARVTMRIS